MPSRPVSASRRPRPATRGAVARERILDAVNELFYRQGTQAVGVDAVVKRAGVNKMSLYRQFGSKDELLRLYLEHRNAMFWDYVEASLAKHPDDPGRQLVQLFIDLAERIKSPGYRGCPFVNITPEYPDPAHPLRKIVADNKAQFAARLLELTSKLGMDDPERLANTLALLIEGAYAASQTYGPSHPLLASLPEIAASLLGCAQTRASPAPFPLENAAGAPCSPI